MHATNRILKAGICISIMGALMGCATQRVSPQLSPQTDTDIVRPSWLDSSWKIIYSPQIHPGKTFDDALADIEKYRATNDITVAYETQRPSQYYRLNRIKVGSEILSIQLKGYGKPVDLRFLELPEYTVYVIQCSPNKWNNYGIALHGLVSFYSNDLTDMMQIADDLFLIQQHMKERKEHSLSLFESQAAQYRALAIKPPMSEDQRKLVVQANTMNRLKDYDGSIKLYLKAIDMDPFSYPEAYFNLALINAQIKQYDAAINYMKQYLMLVPDAKDARSAQDRIYEWEILMKKQGS